MGVLILAAGAWPINEGLQLKKESQEFYDMMYDNWLVHWFLTLGVSIISFKFFLLMSVPDGDGSSSTLSILECWGIKSKVERKQTL